MPLPFQRRSSSLTPTFSRDFAGLKTLDHGAGPAITFTRGSNATYFDAAGVLQTAGNNVPRFDHDPATGASRGLLIEEARTNLLASSKTFSGFSGGGWTSVTDNHSASPDGTTTASLFEWSVVANSYKFGSTTITNTAAATYTVTAFVKPVSGTGVMGVRVGRTDSSQFVESRLNLQTNANTSQTTGGDVSGAVVSAQNVGNGWYRLSATGTFSNSYANFGAMVNAVSGSGSFLVWGVQLELGAFPTSYIPTTNATATRSADSAVVTPISSFYNQSEGTLFAEAVFNAPNSHATSQLPVEFYNTDANRFRIGRLQPNGFPLLTNTIDNTIDVSIAGTSAITQFSAAKILGVYKINDFALYFNGSAIGTDTLATPISATHLRIGAGQVGNGFIANGHIRKVAYWPRRLSNTLLQQITT